MNTRTIGLRVAPMALFFLSGATALIYEVLWSKHLTLLFGSTTQAQTVVLAVFMGGLAIGNRIFGGRAWRGGRPLAWYGCLEIAIGVYAFAFFGLFQAADGAFVAWGARWLDAPLPLLALKGALSLILLLPPTILMGGTLPVLAAWLESQYADAARWSVRFYSLNTFGAVLGAWLAGFFLVEWLGMFLSLQVTAAANVLAGVAALGLARLPEAASRMVDAARNDSASPSLVPERVPPADARWLGCGLVAFTGAVSIGLETLSSRALALVFGASLPAFSVMLISFILGIGVGSAVIASSRVRHWPRELTTYALLLLTAAVMTGWVLAIGPGLEGYRALCTGLGRTAMGYRYQLLLNTLMAILVLGVPAAFLGSVLPLWIREGAGAGDGLARQVGRLLTWNTLGAVLGAVVTGFLLMPGLGLRGATLFLALLLTLAALVLAAVRICRWSALIALLAMGGVALSWGWGGAHWRVILNSGVFRMRETDLNRGLMKSRERNVRLLFYEDAPDATVSVETNALDPSGEVGLRINGKNDASSVSDLSTQYLLAHLPLMCRPESQAVFVFGFGSGITAGALLGHPVRSIVVAENCAPVLRASRWFDAWNHGVLTNPVTRICREDARTVLKLTPERFDVIISEPSNPWTAGIGNVFSEEFFALAAARLKPDGIMAQWFHLYEINDDIISMVLRAFQSVFPYMEIWDASPGDIILLGSKQPWVANEAAYERIFTRPGPRADLARIGLRRARDLYARQLASQATAFAIPGPGLAPSDEFPRLESAAPRAFFIGAGSTWIFEFDERTWQGALAPAEKRRALLTLEDTAVRDIFTPYRSMNSELMLHLDRQLRGGKRVSEVDAIMGAPPLPCLFRQLEPPGVPGGASPDGDSPEQVLARAEVGLRVHPENWVATVDEFFSIFRKPPPGPISFELAGHYAAVAADAARAALAHGDAERARRAIKVGRQFRPASNVFPYLQRILDAQPRAPAG